MKVLFSPISLADPINKESDGPMLHICRKYKPDIIYLYYSEEMKVRREYCETAINLLYESMNESCVIEEPIFDDETEVHDFDKFIDIFKSNIQRIKKETNCDELLVNVSSGTPAMMNSLLVLSMFDKDLTAVQVATPERKSNYPQQPYDVYEQWEKNKDCVGGSDDRSAKSGAKKIYDEFLKENIKSFIEAYDYEAAKVMSDSLSYTLPENYKNGLEIAIKRNQLTLNYESIGKTSFANWFSEEKDINKLKEYEYLLSMKAKYDRGQYADFIKDITPILVSLAERALKILCDIDINSILITNDPKKRIDRDKLKKAGLSLDDSFGNKPFISTAIVLKLIPQKYNGNNKSIQLLNNLRFVEDKVRNITAHNLVGLNDDKIKAYTSEKSKGNIGYTGEQILNMLFELMFYTGFKYSVKDKALYNKMNDSLIELLNN